MDEDRCSECGLLSNKGKKVLMEHHRKNPIYYRDDPSQLDRPLSELMNDLRNQATTIRGKLFDIKFARGWNDRIEHIEGGLTCVIIAMWQTMKEWEKFEKNSKK